MSKAVLSIFLLAVSSYIWPSLYKRSSSEAVFLIITLLGLVVVIVLGWLTPRIESSCRLQLDGRRAAFVVLYSIPVAALQIAFASAYWLQIDGKEVHLGGFGALPAALLILWVIADAGIRGICEEAVFRGILQPALIKRYSEYAGGVWIAIIFTTFWFLVVHLYGIADFHLLPYLALLSIWYGRLVVQTQHFLSSAILHAAHNSIAMLVAYVGLPKSVLGYSEPGLFWVVMLAVANFFAVNWLAKEWTKARRSTTDAARAFTPPPTS